MTRPPLITAPIYLSGAEPPPLAEIAPAAKAACQKCAPFAGLVGATALGVTAAYFAPKFFDWALSTWRDRSDDGGDYVDLEYE